MSRKFIGRKKEQEILKEAMESSEAEMVAVIGRRRVGKTFLINSVLENLIDFEVTGIQDAPQEEQLKNFKIQLGKFVKSAFLIETPKDWIDAFLILIRYLESLKEKRKLVVFSSTVARQASRFCPDTSPCRIAVITIAF